jgi:hypothetical protein
VNPERYARVKELFLEASELPDARRRTLLDRACGGDAELRTEVETLLRFHGPETVISADSTPSLPPREPQLGRHAVKSAPTVQNLTGSASRLFDVVTLRLGPKGQLAWGAVAALLLLAAIGWWAYRGIYNSLRELRAEQLRGFLETDLAALRHWMTHEKAKVASWSRDPSLRRNVAELASIDTDSPAEHESLRASARHAEIRDELREVAGPGVHYSIWNLTSTLIADANENADSLGRRATGPVAAIMSRVFAGETVLRLPYFIDESERGDAPEESAASPDAPISHPVMAVLTPVRDVDDDDKIIAAMLVGGIGTESGFRDIFTHARSERTGETYAFDKRGVLLSESRFPEHLVAAGLISNHEDAHSTLIVQVRDPGGDLTAGFKADRPLAARPLTRMAAFATAGHNDTDLDGYRDYRGVPVIGTWRWLPEHGFGVTTEIDLAEAYAPLEYLRSVFRVILVVLVATIGLIGWWSYSHVWLHQPGEVRQLGQYTLIEPIGEGGMGSVYLARHALLKRPTAIKLLKPELATVRALAWFEREVQLASQLKHPNTIEIYDYGKTADGIFYYAMEFVTGLNLTELIARERSVPPARTIQILRQICLSLREAHEFGLVHRDIKPHNIMLCHRGGEFDIVKVLDFGLVKNVADTSESGQTKLNMTGVLAGTPLYIAPERLRDPLQADARCDVYSLGAVAFNLLTGRDVFEGRSDADIFFHVVTSPPPRPSSYDTEPIPLELDQLIVDCLAKDPAARPQSVSEILAILDAIRCESRWGQSDAQRWWKKNFAIARPSKAPAVVTRSPT